MLPTRSSAQERIDIEIKRIQALNPELIKQIEPGTRSLMKQMQDMPEIKPE